MFMHSWADSGTSEEASGQTSSSSCRGSGDVVAVAGSVGDGADGRSQSDSAARENALRRCLPMREAAAKADEGGGEDAEIVDMGGLSDSTLCGVIFGKGGSNQRVYSVGVVCFVSVLQRPEIINPWTGLTHCTITVAQINPVHHSA
jgi:hypothetical protein